MYFPEIAFRSSPATDTKGVCIYGLRRYAKINLIRTVGLADLTTACEGPKIYGV